jgi:serine/threonine protein kinase
VSTGVFDSAPVIIATATLRSESGDPQELRAAAAAVASSTSLQHPHIISTYSMALTRAPPPVTGSLREPSKSSCLNVHIVHEFCSGGCLRDALAAGVLTLPAQTQPFAAVMRILRDVASGMEYAHSCGVAHGCLSASTIYIAVRPLRPLPTHLHASMPPCLRAFVPLEPQWKAVHYAWNHA